VGKSNTCDRIWVWILESDSKHNLGLRTEVNVAQYAHLMVLMRKRAACIRSIRSSLEDLAVQKSNLKTNRPIWYAGLDCR
jgi:hypothetical protein